MNNIKPSDKLHSENERILRLVSLYLNVLSDAVNKQNLESITGGDTSANNYAYSAIMASACGLQPYENVGDKELFRRYFVQMVKGQAISDYINDPYYVNIKVPNAKFEAWELCSGHYAPYEAFVYDDIEMRSDGRLLPHIGYFTEKFSYPRVTEKGREWMTVTPNEINTMRNPIEKARGDTLAFGLGLGYYAYMVSEKSTVTSVTVVERDASVIRLFERFLLPQFPNKKKIRIVCDDAFAFADREFKNSSFDHIFTDIWHDPSDGLELYLEMKKREALCPHARFDYWIEKTLKCYLGESD